jgi:ATP-binding protein involved in chromosome partitioning
MNRDELKRSVLTVLSEVVHPHTGENLISGGYIRNLSIDEGGAVSFAFVLQPRDPGTLVKEARTAVEGLPGVTDVKVNVQLPRAGGAGMGTAAGAGARDPAPSTGSPGAPAGAPPGGGPTPGGPPGGPGPGRGGPGGGGLQPGSVPAPTPKPDLLADVDHVIAVSSGKGGVGKSMVATNLAAALAREGLRVGLLDADIYGPNIPRMFGETRRPRVTGEKGKEMIEPLEAHGVRLMSLGFLLEDEQPAIMRGPLIAGILKQFLEQVDWGPLDVMVVDMPPGTGDAQLSLVQTIDVDGVVMVSTSQEVATGDVRRGVKMFERVNTRVLGVTENMSGLVCPHCDEEIDVFGSGGGERLAREMGLPFLGRIPLDPAVRRAGDGGIPTVLDSPESPAGRALAELAREVFRALRTAEEVAP